MSGRLKQLRERLLHLSESLAPPGAYYGEDDPFTFCDAQDREALGVAIGLLDAEIAEREAPPPVSLEALRAWVRTKANAEPGERFKGLPERWLDNPTWRCLNGHVSKRVLKTEEHGDLCLACRERLVFTFPEDKDGQIEAPPPVLEEGLAKIAKQLESVGAFFHTVIYKPGGEPVEATVTVNTAAGALRALALRGARPATRAEWLAIAADLAQDEGVVTEGLARAVASMLPALMEHESVRGALAAQPLVGAWNETRETRYNGTRSFETVSLSRFAYAYKPAAMVIPRFQPGTATITDYLWATYTDEGDRRLWQTAPTLCEAMIAADATLRAEGWILLGGLPDEVALAGAAATATVDDDGRLVPADDGDPEVERRPGPDEEEPVTLPEWRPANAPTCNGCGGTGLQTRGVVVSACPVCGGRRWVPPIEPVTPPVVTQPDASWLRHVRRGDRDTRLGWVYEGGTLLQLAQFPSGAIPLLTWLNARGQLIGDPEYFQGEGLPRVRIVTRAPLDGDWCANCGENIDGERFLTSRIRIVAGEEARVCGDCAEDSDGGWP